MSNPASPQWSLAIHGGAGSMKPGRFTAEEDAAFLAGLDAALEAGTAVLAAGGSAMDAVEAAVTVLEDDPQFNAGRGSVFAFEGHNEMDAAVMNGADRTAGAVTGTRITRNPVRAARAVMEKTPHVILSGEGADRFAAESGLAEAGPDWFATPHRRAQWEEFREKDSGWFDTDLKYGTVGAVARDSAGHLAAATSTGGLTGKRWGRIGDSPVIGAGTFADDRGCAISATGTGEVFIRAGAAHEINARMRLCGETAQQAMDEVMADIGELGGEGGMIYASCDGSVGFAFNTSGMFRGRADSEGLRETAIYKPD